MHCKVILQAKDFKRIHNGLCDMRTEVKRLDGVIDPKVVRSMNKSIKAIERGLADCYAQEQVDLDRRLAHYKPYEVQFKHSIWSMYEVEDMEAPHAHQGAREVLYIQHWGTSPVRVPVPGNTWADLWAAADQAIQQSGDSHHIYVEAFRRSDTEPGVLILSTGS